MQVFNEIERYSSDQLQERMIRWAEEIFGVALNESPARVIRMNTMAYTWELPACVDHQDLVMHSLPENCNILEWEPPQPWLECVSCLPHRFPVVVKPLGDDAGVIRWVWPDRIPF